MADGAARFGQGSSGPALLRMRTGSARISHTGLSPSTAGLSRPLPLCTRVPSRPSYNPARASTRAVWAGPLSLAATRGVTVVFLSSAYLDVSVRRVGLPLRDAAPSARRVAPFGHPRILACSRLPADYRSLLRPSSPPGAEASPVCPVSLASQTCRPRNARPSILALLFLSNALFSFPGPHRLAPAPGHACSALSSHPFKVPPGLAPRVCGE